MNAEAPVIHTPRNRLAPIQLPALKVLNKMFIWLSVLALSALLVMCKSLASCPPTSIRNAQLLTMLFALPVTFRYRAKLIPFVPNPVKSFFPGLRHYTPVSTFADQANAGLSSESFDIEANVREGDSRVGLDERGTQEVLDIMRRQRVK